MEILEEIWRKLWKNCHFTNNCR